MSERDPKGSVVRAWEKRQDARLASEAALPSPSGPDAETLAAPLDWHGEGDPLPLLAESLERSLRDALDDMCRPLTTAYEREIARLAAVEALSGLVALVEQRERDEP